MGFLDWFRKSPPHVPTGAEDTASWRAVYKSLIDRDSFLGGSHMQYAKLTNSQFTPIGPLAVLLREHWPTYSDDEIQVLLNQWKREFDGGQQHGLVTDILTQLGASKGTIQGPELGTILVEKMLQHENYNGYLVRYVIGQVIEHDLGSDQKHRYWRAVLTREIV